MNTNTIIYILVAIAVVAAGYLILTDSPEEANAPADTGMEAAERESEEMGSTEPDSEVMDDDEAPETDPEDGTVQGGNDVGMEFPEPDVELDADAEAGASADTTDVVEVTLDAFNYGYSEDTLRVSEGDTVTVTITSTDGFHDWVLDEFGAATERVRDGETTSVTFVASEAGTYEFYCSVGNHREQGMVGTLIVE